MPGVQLVKRVALKKKEVDDVLGGDEAWANVQKTDGGLIDAKGLAGSSEGRACYMHAQHAPCGMLGWDCRNVNVDALGEQWAQVRQPSSPHRSSLPASAAVTCPKCSYHQAYFMEIQIRSADEPATLFFKCVQCAAQWREG